MRAFFLEHFSPYRVAAADGGDTGLVTGYYEPLLAGSRTRTDAFAVPLYAPPDDLLTVDLSSLFPELKDKRVRGRVEGRKVVPYWSRADLEADHARLAGKALVVRRRSGRGVLPRDPGLGPHRTRRRHGAAPQLRRPERPSVQVDRRACSSTAANSRRSARRCRRSARGRRRIPDKTRALLDENPSFVFFREVPAPAPGSLDARIDGPQGALGVPLLAERTIAVDPRAIPLGAPVYLATTMPNSPIPLERLVLAQDTGGAIRGVVRADFFWGFGPRAGQYAGRMRQQGRMWLLWPKGAPLPASEGRP